MAKHRQKQGITVVGIDLSKRWLPVYGRDESGPVPSPRRVAERAEHPLLGPTVRKRFGRRPLPPGLHQVPQALVAGDPDDVLHPLTHAPAQPPGRFRETGR